MSDVLLLPLHRYVDSNWGSEYAWALNICEALRTAGLSYVAVVGDLDKKAFSALSTNRNTILRLGTSPEYNFYNNFSFYSKLYLIGQKAIRLHSPNVIHHVFPFSIDASFNPIFATKRMRNTVLGPVLFPSYLFGQDSDGVKLMEEIGMWRKNKSSDTFILPHRLLRIFWERTLLNTEILLFDCSETRDIAMGLFPDVQDKEYEVIPTGGVNNKFFTQNNKKVDSNLSSSFTVGTLCWLRKRKHVDTIIRAIAEMKDKKIRAIIGGEGYIKQYLISLAKQLGVSEKVEFVGRIDRKDVPSFYSNLDVYCMMDRFPHTALSGVQEAMAFGLPVVVSSPYASAESDELNYGYIIDAENYKELSRIFLRLIENPSIVSEKGTNAMNYAMENFSIERVGYKLKKIYDKL
jgi:glycosyltransferase involved in cell wall biosynthesis